MNVTDFVLIPYRDFVRGSEFDEWLMVRIEAHDVKQVYALLRKGKPKTGYTFPVQAWKMTGSPGFPDFIGSFYGRHAKRDAKQAVLDANPVPVPFKP